MLGRERARSPQYGAVAGGFTRRGSMVLRNLLLRATRSLLTVIGIAIGVAAVVSLGAMA